VAFLLSSNGGKAFTQAWEAIVHLHVNFGWRIEKSIDYDVSIRPRWALKIQQLPIRSTMY
jgi:hypothetical protein